MPEGKRSNKRRKKKDPCHVIAVKKQKPDAACCPGTPCVVTCEESGTSGNCPQNTDHQDPCSRQKKERTIALARHASPPPNHDAINSLTGDAESRGARPRFRSPSAVQSARGIPRNPCGVTNRDQDPALANFPSACNGTKILVKRKTATIRRRRNERKRLWRRARRPDSVLPQCWAPAGSTLNEGTLRRVSGVGVA